MTVSFHIWTQPGCPAVPYFVSALPSCPRRMHAGPKSNSYTVLQILMEGRQACKLSGRTA